MTGHPEVVMLVLSRIRLRGLSAYSLLGLFRLLAGRKALEISRTLFPVALHRCQKPDFTLFQ
jgi:hypothetical protein